MLAGALESSTLTGETLLKLFLPTIPFYIIANAALELLIIPGLLFIGWRAARRILVIGAAALYFLLRVWTYLAFVPSRMDFAEAGHTSTPMTEPERQQAYTELMLDDPRWIVLLVIFGIWYSRCTCHGFAPWVGCPDKSNPCHVGPFENQSGGPAEPVRSHAGGVERSASGEGVATQPRRDHAMRLRERVRSGTAIGGWSGTGQSGGVSPTELESVAPRPPSSKTITAGEPMRPLVGHRHHPVRPAMKLVSSGIAICVTDQGDEIWCALVVRGVVFSIEPGDSLATAVLLIFVVAVGTGYRPGSFLLAGAGSKVCRCGRRLHQRLVTS